MTGFVSHEYVLSIRNGGTDQTVRAVERSNLTSCRFEFGRFVDSQPADRRSQFVADIFILGNKEPAYCLHVGARGGVVILPFVEELQRRQKQIRTALS